MPQFAVKFKEANRGLIYFTDTFVIGLIGNTTSDALITELEAACKEMSKNKAVKTNKKADVKFDYKIKGQKPVQTKAICMFNITGGDFKDEKIIEILEKHAASSLDI